MLETALAVKRGLPAEHVFTFASTRMPVAAAPIATKAKTTVYYGSAADAPLNPMEIELFSRVGADIECVAGMPPAAVSGLALVTEGALGDRWTAASVPASVAGVVSPEALYVTDRALLPPAEVLVVRKRLATPLTTPAAERALQALAGVPLTADEERADTEAVAAFEAHLQTMSGTDADATHPPVSFTAGLPALCSVWTAMIAMGGADVLMCSTAYGGSSQMTDLLVERVPTLRKHTFDIQGVGTCLSTSIKDALDRLAQDEGSKSIPATLLAVEIPTNPDMKVPDMREVAEMLAAHGTETGKDVLLLVDTTFAPASGVLGKLREACDGLPAVAFVSMSKSVSRGVTTAGAVVANHTAYARDVLKGVAAVASAFDTGARPDQVQRLAANHVGVEERCKKAYVECSGLVPQRARYAHAAAVGEGLVAAVKSHTGEDMPLAFVSPASAAIAFTTSTFSFNLPAPAGADAATCEALAQRFVDLLCAHAGEFKPCVSFGQDNGLVYATVPATSTQGAIRAEDKAKQAVGGVQLVRLSFPVTCDTAAVSEIVADAIAAVYA
eukprot:PRCOL_00005529-RA